MFLRFLVVDHRVKFLCFDSDLPRGGSGHYWCNSQGAVGASGVVSARILAIQMSVRGGRFFRCRANLATMAARRHSAVRASLVAGSAQVGSFLHKFLAHRWVVLGRSAPIFKEWITAGKIWPLCARDDTGRQRHHRCNATATVGASRLVYVWILLAHGDLRGVI